MSEPTDQLPPEYNRVQVRGRFVRLTGDPAAGSLTFTSQGGVTVAQASGVIILPDTIRVELNEDGAFMVELPATDDPDVLPNGWTYAVREEVGTGGRQYNIDVPIAALATGIELEDIAPVQPSPGDPTAFVTLTAFEELVERVDAIDPGGGAVTWADVTDKPTEFPPSAHTHPIAQVDGLVDALADASEPTLWAQIPDKPTDFPPSPHTHVWTDIENPPAFLTEPEGDARYLPATYTPPDPAWVDVTGKPTFATVATTGAYGDLTGAPALAPVATSGAYGDLTGQPTIPTTPEQVGAAPAVHTHPIGQVDGLQGQLDGIGSDITALEGRPTFLVLAPGDPVPGGTAPGTLIFRTA